MQVWKNLRRSTSEIRRAQTIGWLWLIAVSAFNTVPLLIISVLANLASVSALPSFHPSVLATHDSDTDVPHFPLPRRAQLTAYVPFLEKWSEESSGTFTFVSGVLPPAVSALFGWALPIIMRRLTKYMGAYTHSRMDRAVVARYFTFLVISQLIIFTLIGVIFSESRRCGRES